MAAPTDRNRLDEEESPYLQAHADNPVNWQPWDETALEAAKEREVPIFLSIGYAACHWCHVMAEESFEDEAIAEQLNRDFVPIKLDREERPDIDSIYMTVCRLVNRSGCGWPLSVWLTPEGEPFYIGTYFPKESARGQPGFGDLLADISEQWAKNRSELENRAQQWMAAARDNLESTPEPVEAQPSSELVTEAAQDLVRRADREHGGFGGGQKFPQPSRLGLLSVAAKQGAVPDAETVLDETLTAMAEGGLRDQLGGGFHRYCVDREWVVPHFEKMLYDNASIPEAYLAAAQLTGNDQYAAIAEETFAFVDRELRHPGGAFYSTLDARSQPPTGADETPGRGVEGAFYVWTPEEVADAIRSAEEQGSDTTASDQIDVDEALLVDLVTDRYGITPAGNFEGKTVLTQARSIDDMAAEYDRDPAEIQRLLEVAEERLRRAREERPRPPRDEKILAGWNGLMIAALAEGAIVLQNETYADRATAALDFVRETLWDGHHLQRRFKETDADSDPSEGDMAGGSVKGDGVLEDYAFLAQGALRVYEATGRVQPLVFALELTRAIRREFWDPDRETLFFTPTSGDTLPVRPQEVADQSTPSSMGIAVQVLLAMDAFDPDEGFGDIAETVLQTHAATIRDAPMQHPSLVRAADIQEHGHLELTISAADPPAEWLEFVGERYLPDRLLAPRPPDEDTLDEWVAALDLSAAPPIWAGREARSGPTMYICRTACSPPATDRDEIEEWVTEFER